MAALGDRTCEKAVICTAASMDSDDSGADKEMTLNSHLKLDMDQSDVDTMWRQRAELAERKVARLQAELADAKYYSKNGVHEGSPDTHHNNRTWLRWLSACRVPSNNTVAMDKPVDWQEEARQSAEQVLSLQLEASDLKSQLEVMQQQLKDTQSKLDETTVYLQGQQAATAAAHREAEVERSMKEQLQQENKGLESQLQQLRELLMVAQRHSDDVVDYRSRVHYDMDTDARLMQEEAELRRLYSQLEVAQKHQNWLQRQSSFNVNA